MCLRSFWLDTEHPYLNTFKSEFASMEEALYLRLLQNSFSADDLATVARERAGYGKFAAT